MLNPIGQSKWILCTRGLGYACPHGVRDEIRSHFLDNSIGVVLEEMGEEVRVFLPGQDQMFIVDRHDTSDVDVYATGKGYEHMICNICFVRKSENEFQINQTDAKGRKTRRPSCNICRQDIDRRSIPSREKKEAKRLRPKKGTLWRCPICRKMGIVGVNVKVVADHDHYAGRWRGHLCDSCNTGLGRFKNGESYLLNAIAYLKEHEVTK
ncbi:MAG: Hpy99I family type II restriction endonuclease [Chloroflexi bacterium]|nr:Hpy99I family type II restriction endonuclease [Chloroflexota bacterium]